MEYKRSRIHGKRAKTRQQVYEERIDRERRAGTYETSIGVLGDEEVKDDESPNDNNPTVAAPSVCKWCSENSHKIWRAKK